MTDYEKARSFIRPGGRRVGGGIKRLGLWRIPSIVAWGERTQAWGSGERHLPLLEEGRTQVPDSRSIRSEAQISRICKGEAGHTCG